MMRYCNECGCRYDNGMRCPECGSLDFCTDEEVLEEENRLFGDYDDDDEIYWTGDLNEYPDQ